MCVLCSRTCVRCEGKIGRVGREICSPCLARDRRASARQRCPRCGKPGRIRAHGVDQAGRWGLLDTAAGRDDNGVRGREGIESALDAARNQPPTSAVSRTADGNVVPRIGEILVDAEDLARRSEFEQRSPVGDSQR